MRNSDVVETSTLQPSPGHNFFLKNEAKPVTSLHSLKTSEGPCSLTENIKTSWGIKDPLQFEPSFSLQHCILLLSHLGIL